MFALSNFTPSGPVFISDKKRRTRNSTLFFDIFLTIFLKVWICLLSENPASAPDEAVALLWEF